MGAARQLAGRLSVTLLLADAGRPPAAEPASSSRSWPGRCAGRERPSGRVLGRGAGASAMAVSSRDRLRMGRRQEQGKLEADLIVDLRRGQPLFTAHGRRDGYLRAEPRDPVAIQRALFDAAGLVGEFEKPRHVAFDAGLCAHSRSRRIGCTRCLDQCPTGAITPAGDHVAIDPWVCAGCGSCAGVCPTGAASYASPSAEALLRRLRSARSAPISMPAARHRPLLVHEERHGGELIDAIARLGRGLPARVLPFAVPEIAQLGFEFLAAAPAYGARRACSCWSRRPSAARSPAWRRRSAMSVPPWKAWATAASGWRCWSRTIRIGSRRRSGSCRRAPRRAARRFRADGRQAGADARGA